MHNLLDWLTLFFTPSLGSVGSKRLLEHFGGAREILAASAAQLGRIDGLRKQAAHAILVKEGKTQALKELQKIEEQGVSIIPWDAPDYPDLLRNIPDPPVLLYAKGDRGCLDGPAVAMVGARAATSYGRKVAKELACSLARQSVCIVSGLALGIDTAAHTGALNAGGKTIAVLGCGIDIAYPPQNRKLHGTIAEKGLLLSEYPLGTAPEAFRFPARNRIISGISRGVAVIEAARRSGSLITADLALDQGREVFAVPGSIGSSKSEGCHRLIQQGAKLVHSADDILEELPAGIVPETLPNQAVSAAAAQPIENLNKDEHRIITCLDAYPRRMDEIIAATGLSAQQTSSLLLGLELKGVVASLPGSMYQRT